MTIIFIIIRLYLFQVIHYHIDKSENGGVKVDFGFKEEKGPLRTDMPSWLSRSKSVRVAMARSSPKLSRIRIRHFAKPM